MKTRSGSLIFLWMVPLLAVMAHGCASTRSASTDDAGQETGAKVPAVSNISFHESERKVTITVVADAIASYATYRTDNPSRLVVDLQGVVPGIYDKPIEINRGTVTTMVPSSMQSDKTRFEIGLTGQSEFNVAKKGNSLVIEVDKAAGSLAAPGPVSAQVAPASGADTISAIISSAEKEKKTQLPQGTVMAPATAVTDVSVTTGLTGTTVVIKGNGLLGAEVLLLEDTNLVVDLPEVKNTVYPNAFVVNDPFIGRVRVGQFTDPARKVRVALELKGKVAYALSREKDKVVLTLNRDTMAKKEAATVEASTESADNHVASDGDGFTGKKISLDFQDADLKSVVRLIAEVSGLNLVLAPDVKGTVSVKMLNVPWDQALDLILRINGLGQVREGNIIRVMSAADIAKEDLDYATRKEAAKKAEDTISRIIPVNYAKAMDLMDPLKKSLSARGDITVETRTNTLIIKDVPSNVQDIQTLIRILDKQTPQVMIEARIVEATTDFSRELGIQWGYNYQKLKGDSTWQAGIAGTKASSTATTTDVITEGIGPKNSGFAVNLPAAVGLGAGGAFGIGFSKITGGSMTAIDLNLSALESSGKGKVISSPKVLALDNKEATIKQGSSIPYATTSAAGTSTTWVDAALELNVTPHVTPDNSIIMKIKASKNAPGTTTVAGPIINKKEANTEILIKDGETVVIGGIYEVTKSDGVDGVPFLSKIPVLGWLFKKESIVDTKRELLIFLTPKIMPASN